MKNLTLIVWGISWLLLSAARGAELEGTWRWTFTMPDGSVANPTLRLSLENGVLSGTSSFRAGSEVPITNATFSKGELRFQVVRQRDGEEITTTYHARLSGNALVGRIESDWAGEPRVYDWRAEKLDGPNGTWRWAVNVGERKVEMQLHLKQSGARLEGSYGGRGRFRSSRIHKGAIDDDGQLSFEVEVGPEDARRVLKYSGRLRNDTITGTYRTTVGGVVREADWVARRAP